MGYEKMTEKLTTEQTEKMWAEHVYEELHARIARMKKEIDVAESFLSRRDFAQCALSLHEAGNESVIDSSYLNLINVLSGGYE